MVRLIVLRYLKGAPTKCLFVLTRLQVFVLILFLLMANILQLKSVPLTQLITIDVKKIMCPYYLYVVVL